MVDVVLWYSGVDCDDDRDDVGRLWDEGIACEINRPTFDIYVACLLLPEADRRLAPWCEGRSTPACGMDARRAGKAGAMQCM